MNMFGNIFMQKRCLEARVRGIERCLEQGESSVLISFEKVLQTEYSKVLVKEEMM